MLLHVQIDLHAAINVTRDLDRGNMAKLAQDATKLKKGGLSRMASSAFIMLHVENAMQPASTTNVHLGCLQRTRMRRQFLKQKSWQKSRRAAT